MYQTNNQTEQIWGEDKEEVKNPLDSEDENDDDDDENNKKKEIEFKPLPQDFNIQEVIDIKILDTIFQSRDLKEQTEAVKQFHLALREQKLSFPFLFQIIVRYLNLEQGHFDIIRVYLSEILPQFLGKYRQLKLRSIFLRSIFKIYSDFSKNNTILSASQFEVIQNKWTEIPESNLIEFIEIFQLKDKITYTQVKEKVQKQLNHKNINKETQQNTKNFILAFIYQPDWVKEIGTLFINKLTTNKDASFAAKCVSLFGLNQDDFPDLLMRLEKLCIRHYMKEGWPWYQLADFFASRPQMLGYICEDLYYKQLKKEAYTIIQKYDLIKQGYIKKQDTLAEILKDEQTSATQPESEKIVKILESDFDKYDEFMPVEDCLQSGQNQEQDQYYKQSIYLRLQDFNIDVKDPNKFLLIDNTNDGSFEKARNLIQNSSQIGLDCEFNTHFTKFDKQKGKKLSLIQIYSNNPLYVVLIDTSSLNSEKLDEQTKLQNFSKLQEMFVNILTQSQILICGQSVKDDLELIAYFYKFNEQQRKGIKKFLNLELLYKEITNAERIIGLAATSQFLFGKLISKGCQISNWEKRPLRKFQLHYGAMDAVMSLECVEAIRKKYDLETVEEEINKILHYN